MTRRRLTEQALRAAIERNPGIRPVKLAEVLGVSADAIRQAARRFGIIFPHGLRKVQNIERVKTLTAAGWSMVAIAAELGVSHQRVQQMQKQYGIAIPQVGRSLKEAADELGIRPDAARRLAESVGITLQRAPGRRRWLVSDDELESLRAALEEREHGHCAGCGRECRRSKYCSPKCRSAHEYRNRIAGDGHCGRRAAKAMRAVEAVRRQGRLVGRTEASRISGLTAMQLIYLQTLGALSVAESSTLHWRGQPCRLYYEGEVRAAARVYLA